MANWLNLEGKVVAVTGGASGIGKHIASTLVDAGANTVVIDMNAKTGEVIDGAYQIQCNVTDPESVKAMMAEIIRKYGHIDAIVNNAGINLPRLLVDVKGEKPQYELDAASFDKMFAVNVKGLLTKGAVDSFTRSWAKELGKYNIRVVAVAPGIMEATGLRTPAYNEALAYTRGVKPEELSTDYTKVIPIGRDGKLDEVGDFVAYLVSDRASYITGTTLNISGGKSRG